MSANRPTRKEMQYVRALMHICPNILRERGPSTKWDIRFTLISEGRITRSITLWEIQRALGFLYEDGIINRYGNTWSLK